MKRFLNERTLYTVVVISSALVVVLLAALLYWRSNQVSEMTTVRLADSLQMSMVNWHLNLFRDLSDVVMALRMDSDRGEFNELIHRFGEWKTTSPYPDLILGLYILKRNATGSFDTLALDPAKQQFVRADVPPEIHAL